MKKNIYRRKIIFMIIILIAVIALTNVFSFAKYTANKIFDYYLESKGFYFYSDSLSENGTENVNTMWNGEKIYFEINNGLSDSQVSEFDIEYEINCTVKDESNKKCYLNGTGLENVSGTLSAYESCTDKEDNDKEVNFLDKKSCEDAGFKWSFKKTSFQPYFEVFSTDNKADVNSALVEITVSSTKPYKKEIKGTYWLVRNQNNIGELSMVFEEKEVLSSIIISNSYDADKCVELSWNKTKLLLAEDTSDLQTVTSKDSNYTTSYFTVTAKNSIIFNYFKNNKNVLINEEDFTLVESELCQ